MSVASPTPVFDAVTLEVDPRLESAIGILSHALNDEIERGDAVDAALELLISARGWLIIPKQLAITAARP